MCAVSKLFNCLLVETMLVYCNGSYFHALLALIIFSTFVITIVLMQPLILIDIFCVGN
jgi:hypothetical protein